MGGPIHKVAVFALWLWHGRQLLGTGGQGSLLWEKDRGRERDPVLPRGLLQSGAKALGSPNWRTETSPQADSRFVLCTVASGPRVQVFGSLCFSPGSPADLHH